MPNFFSSNLKYLRKAKELTQADFAFKIGINRPKVGSYEEGRAEPSLETLQNISHFFKIKIDDLIEKNLSLKNNLKQKNIEGNNLRVLPIIVNEEQQTEKISLVPIKASAGYLNGYSDPEFIEELPHFNLPFSQLSQGTYRAFQIKGDSMLPIQSGSYILAEYVSNWNWIKSGSCYIVISKDDGVVYKRVSNKIEDSKQLELHSDNGEYDSYTIDINQVIEVWIAKGFISFDLPEEQKDEWSVNQLSDIVMQLKSEIDQLKEK